MTTGHAARLTQFDYLLNAFELATQADHPSALSYGDKRRALFDYVRKAEAALDEVATLRAERDRQDQIRESLKLELGAAKANHLRDNHYLIEQRDALRARVQQLEQAACLCCQDGCSDGCGCKEPGSDPPQGRKRGAALGTTPPGGER
jgi:hypothetical protein